MPRLSAPRRLLRPEPAQGLCLRGYRLLYPRLHAPSVGHGYLRLHGSHIGIATGVVKVLPPRRKKIVAVIGDSTFLHTGVNGLMDMVYNNAPATVIILDNRITAMTGRQDNPASGSP